MTKPFVPQQKQKKIPALILEREAVLLTKLRKYPYGTFTIHKFDNTIVRLEAHESQNIDEEMDIDTDMIK